MFHRITLALVALSTLTLAAPQEARPYVPYTTTSGAPFRWWRHALTFHLAATTPEEVDPAALPALIAEVFDAWITLPYGVVPEVTFGGSSPAVAATDPRNTDPDNLVVFIRTRAEWQRLGRSASELAVTLIAVDPTTGEILDADIAINDANHVFTLDDTPTGDAISLRAVLLHELGHFYGLSHSAAPDAVMAEAYDAERTSLTADDADGACALYADTPWRSETPDPGDEGCSGTTLPLGASPFMALLAVRRRRR